MGHKLDVYGYHVRYGYTDSPDKKPQIHEGVCFGGAFSSQSARCYTIYIAKGEADLKRYYSNFCFFTKKEIKNHFRQLPKDWNVKYKVTDDTYKDIEAFKVDLDINSKNRLIHKYVLTWTRCLFEWPYNLYLLHARKLKQLPQFKFESIINLLNVVATVHSEHFNWNVHTFGVNLGCLTKKEIVQSCIKHKNVNDVFPRFNIKTPQCKLVNDFDEVTDKLFKNNLNTYLETYKIINNESINYRKKH